MKFYKQKRKETLGNECRVLEKILDGDIPQNGWTSSLAGIPTITHSVVEKYFELTSDEKHVTEGYAFSKTKNFEMSGNPCESTFCQMKTTCLYLKATHSPL